MAKEKKLKVTEKKPVVKEKIEAKKVVEEPKEVVTVSNEKPVSPPAGFLSDVEVVMFENAEVLSILGENENDRLCKMSDGTTKWVPKSVFQKQQDVG